VSRDFERLESVWRGKAGLREAVLGDYRFVLLDFSFIWTPLSGRSASPLPRQDERPFHVHRRGDELEMAMVSREARLTPERIPEARGVDRCVPRLQRMASAGAPEDAVHDP
jgi:hypothetical protein